MEMMDSSFEQDAYEKGRVMYGDPDGDDVFGSNGDENRSLLGRDTYGEEGRDSMENVRRDHISRRFKTEVGRDESPFFYYHLPITADIIET